MTRNLIHIERHTQTRIISRHEAAALHALMRRGFGEPVPNIKWPVFGEHLDVVDDGANERAVLMDLGKFMKRNAAAPLVEEIHKRQHCAEAAERGRIQAHHLQAGAIHERHEIRAARSLIAAAQGRTREPRGPTQAPTGSTPSVLETTAIFER